MAGIIAPGCPAGRDSLARLAVAHAVARRTDSTYALRRFLHDLDSSGAALRRETGPAARSLNIIRLTRRTLHLPHRLTGARGTTRAFI